MEASQSLATESFSYSWLLNPQHPTFHDGTNYFEEDEHNFKFEIPILPSSQHSSLNISLLHYADELFSNGFIKSSTEDGGDDDDDHVDLLRVKSSTIIVRDKDFSIVSSKSRKFSCIILGKSGKMSFAKKIMQKCVDFFGKLSMSKKTEGSRKSSARVDDIYYCDEENPIDDAVLHCKNSINKNKL